LAERGGDNDRLTTYLDTSTITEITEIIENLFNIESEIDDIKNGWDKSIYTDKLIINPWFELGINTYVCSSIEKAQSIYNVYKSII